MKSKKDIAIIESVKRGYYENNGVIFYKGRKLKQTLYGKYYQFGIRIDNKVIRILIHRFIGYKKFGDMIFDKKLQIRHLDSNSLNNTYENIGIGTAKENANDKSPEVRMRVALNASSFSKKHNHEEIIKLHKEGYPYSKIMEKLNIKSKGTISFIIKQSIESKTKNPMN
jgi:hypothetical protein